MDTADDGIMDIQMPLVDGYTATKQIRNLDTKMAKIPIIAMTANAFEEDKEKALVYWAPNFGQKLNRGFVKKSVYLIFYDRFY